MEVTRSGPLLHVSKITQSAVRLPPRCIARIGCIETKRDKHGRESFYFEARGATNIFSPEDKYREYTDYRVVSLANERNTRIPFPSLFPGLCHSLMKGFVSMLWPAVKRSWQLSARAIKRAC